jgi:DNA-binding beta-propeller fold protein YncE
LFIGGWAGDVTVFNLTTSTVERVIPLAGTYIEVAGAPDGEHVFATSKSSHTILSIPTNPTGRVRARTTSESFAPGCVTVTPDGSSVIVGEGQGAVLATFPASDIGAPPTVEWAVVSNPNSFVWAPTGRGHNLFVHEGFGTTIAHKHFATAGAVSSFSCVDVPADAKNGFFDAAYQASTGYVLSVDGQADRIQVSRGTTGAWVGAFATPDLPVGIATKPGTGFAYVTSLRPSALSVYGVSRTPFEPLMVTNVKRIDQICNHPYGVVASPTQPRAFALCEEGIAELDTASNTATTFFPLPKGAHRAVWVP